ncbi:MAG TPA: ATP-dependent DNA ligase, partial [Terrimicrobiaceae bacterium]|nr:ATP-dependent DNA ligase [Terrimicrobiaceae bacterium]
SWLPAADLWLDPRDMREFAFVSHAHSDHTGFHRRVLCTPATARLMQLRLGEDVAAFESLAFGEFKKFDDWAVTLFPAGHVLGSAQLLYQDGSGTLLYTGDFKLRNGLSSEPAAIPQAETLVMETTYGLPRYQFPPTEETLGAIIKFCRETLEEDETPVLFGYALGKAQEILAALQTAHLPVMLHGAIARIARVYEDFGVVFPPYVHFEAKAARGHVIICPPAINGSRTLRLLHRPRTAALTGWAMDAGAVHRLQVDAAFPLSDHADYCDLLRYVEAVRPGRVLTLHGFAQEFSRDLRSRGIEAWALTGANQLELSISMSMPDETNSDPNPDVAMEESGFNRFCVACEAVRTFTGKLEKIRRLSDYLRSLDDRELPLAAVWLTGRPFAQSDSRPLNVGWAVIYRALLIASGISESDLRAIGRRHNDAGLTAAEVMRAKPGSRSLPLSEISELFARLREARGPVLKTEILTGVLKEMPAPAAGYLVRILTGDLRIGLKEGLLEDAIAAAFECEIVAVREAHMLLGDIGQGALLARQNRLEDAELTLFQPVRCMLASPEPDSTAVWQRQGAAGTVWLEDKLDGIRAQVHCASDRVEIFSRDLRRITESFPEIALAARNLGRTVVFDGEILAWEAGRALPFLELQKRLGRREPDLFLGGEIPVAYVIFDVLLFDEASLLKRPLAERRQLLETLRLPEPLLRSKVEPAGDAAAIEKAFAAARERGNEGLLAKDPTSFYTPGRRGLAWIKLKKEFATLDVAVVAVEYGNGRRSKVLSDYTFAVRDDSGDQLLTIGKAYSGLTDAEIQELTELFLSLATSRQGNRIEVEPKVIIEVAFDSIQKSNRHASGLALRFPRIKRIRGDKTLRDIDTLATARRLAGMAE